MIETKKMLRYNTTDRVEYIYAKLNHLGLSKQVIKQILKTDAQCIREILLSCNDVEVHGVGTFKINYKKPQPAHEGHNPQTMEKMLIPAQPEYNKISFTPNKNLKDALKEKTLGRAIMPDRTRVKVDTDAEETDPT